MRSGDLGNNDDKGLLSDVRYRAVDYLASFRLKLNDGKSRVGQIGEGVEVLGFVVLPDRLRLNQKGVRKMRRRMVDLRRRYAAGEASS